MVPESHIVDAPRCRNLDVGA